MCKVVRQPWDFYAWLQALLSPPEQLSSVRRELSQSILEPIKIYLELQDRKGADFHFPTNSYYLVKW